MHATLAVLGYTRTRRIVERLSQREQPRTTSAKDLEEAKALARLAAIAGRYGITESTCLRQSLLVFGWLRRRGLHPNLVLGLLHHDGPFHPHAWVELEGTRLLTVDAGHRPFVSRLSNRDAN
jgi:hypothetical protein